MHWSSPYSNPGILLVTVKGKVHSIQGRSLDHRIGVMESPHVPQNMGAGQAGPQFDGGRATPIRRGIRALHKYHK